MGRGERGWDVGTMQRLITGKTREIKLGAQELVQLLEVLGKTWEVCFHLRLNPVMDTPDVKTSKKHELEEESDF